MRRLERQNAGVVEIRLFQPGDGPAVSNVITWCLREVNSHDYPEDIISRMCAHFSAGQVEKLAEQRQTFVAVEYDGTIVGTVSRDGNKVFTMFIRPQMIGRGLGRRLMSHIEALAAEEGYGYMETGASMTAHGFYHRLGYVDVRTSETDFGMNYLLRKAL